MKKKIIISVLSSIVAIILIVAIVGISIIFSRDLNSDTSFLDKTHDNTLDAPGTTLSVASYNTRSWGSSKENLIAINKKIASYNIDIAGLQEVDSDTSFRSKKASPVSSLTGNRYPYHHFAATNSLFLGGIYGIMNMSIHEIKEAHTMFLPMPSRWFMIKGEPRVLVRTLINVGGVDVAFYNTHLSFENDIKMKNGEEMRASQIEYIFDIMEQDDVERKVLVGDLNILGYDELKIFSSSSKYAMINREDNRLESYRGDDVTFHPLDNIIYTTNLDVIDSGMVDDDMSDHNMLYARFNIK